MNLKDKIALKQLCKMLGISVDEFMSYVDDEGYFDFDSFKEDYSEILPEGFSL